MGLILNRIAIVMVVTTLGRVALTGLMMGNFVTGMAVAVAAAAFASNWPIPLSRPLRLLAFSAQMLTILLMAGAVLLLVALGAQSGNAGWEDAPWWFWVIVVAVVFIIYKATAPGFRLLRDAL